MISILNVVIMTALLSVFVIGLGYGVWKWTRPKKMNWTARIYTLGEGVRKLDTNHDGVANYTLSDLRPFATDILTRDELEKGIETYTLQTLKKTTPAVTEDYVENWGNTKIVNVLYHGGSCTLIKLGYARDLGEAVWHPMSYDRVNALKNDIAVRKGRIQSKKDILQALAPYVVSFLMFLALIGSVWMYTDTAITIEKERTLQETTNTQANIQVATLMRDGLAEYGVKCLELSKV